MKENFPNQKYMLLLAVLIATGLLAPNLFAQAGHATVQPAVQSTTSLHPASLLVPATIANTSSVNRSNYLRHTWGIADLEVRSTSSGELLRFSYRVLDANRAAILNDKKFEPHLIDESSGYMLQIPTLEKVGQLRQTATPHDGVQYWMVFSNKGRLVKPGSRVDIIIGSFRVNALIVDPSALKNSN